MKLNICEVDKRCDMLLLIKSNTPNISLNYIQENLPDYGFNYDLFKKVFNSLSFLIYGNNKNTTTFRLAAVIKHHNIDKVF